MLSRREEKKLWWDGGKEVREEISCGNSHEGAELGSGEVSMSVGEGGVCVVTSRKGDDEYVGCSLESDSRRSSSSCLSFKRRLFARLASR